MINSGIERYKKMIFESRAKRIRSKLALKSSLLF
jgi:hypothetical protein